MVMFTLSGWHVQDRFHAAPRTKLQAQTYLAATLNSLEKMATDKKCVTEFTDWRKMHVVAHGDGQ